MCVSPIMSVMHMDSCLKSYVCVRAWVCLAATQSPPCRQLCARYGGIHHAVRMQACMHACMFVLWLTTTRDVKHATQNKTSIDNQRGLTLTRTRKKNAANTSHGYISTYNGGSHWQYPKHMLQMYTPYIHTTTKNEMDSL